MSKTIYFIANWKMNGNCNSIKEIEKVLNFLKKRSSYQLKKIIFCPPLNLLNYFRKKIKNKLIDFGAQDISKINANYGPYTGQLSGKMLKDSGANYVIIGHSEKRLFDEDSTTIKQKINSALKNTNQNYSTFKGHLKRLNIFINKNTKYIKDINLFNELFLETQNLAIFTIFNNIPDIMHPLPNDIYMDYGCYISFIEPKNKNDDIISLKHNIFKYG
mgnify:CR=1 FL=1